MTDQHPITPPPELVQKWANSSPIQHSDESWAYELFIAHQAARWGADQELEACVEWLRNENWTTSLLTMLHAARRPKPPSPKEEALQVLENLLEARRIVDPEYQALRHALEQLDD